MTKEESGRKKPSFFSVSAFKETGEGTIKRIMGPGFSGAAAEVTFWLLLSMAPASILLAQLLRFFTISMDAAKNVLSAYLAEEVYEIIGPLLDYSSRRGITVMFIILALWAGSSAVFSLMRIINQAYGVAPKTSNTIKHYIMDRFRAILMTLLMLVTIIFALYILVYGEVFIQSAISYSNNFLGVEYTFSAIWYGARWLIAFILFFIMVFSIYYFLARSGVVYRKHFTKSKLATVKRVLRVWLKNRRREYMRAIPGTLFASIAILIATRIYTYFVQNVALRNINIIYGGLSSVVVLLIWFYVISLILIIGAQVNASYAEYVSRCEGLPAGSR